MKWHCVVNFILTGFAGESACKRRASSDLRSLSLRVISLDALILVRSTSASGSLGATLLLSVAVVISGLVADDRFS